jgi:hypothetical protein
MKPLSIVGLVAIVVGLMGSVAHAATAAPPITSLAWYWEDASTQEIKDPAGNTYTIETPSPFCPTAPGSLGAPGETCADGRLPVEVHEGDYETPNKVSGVGFDLSLVPIGSKVQSFTVTFLEAKTGCYDKGNDQDPDADYCEETDAINITDKELQACAVTQFFGDGDARQYKELPNFTCSDTDPIAKREEVKTKDGAIWNVWKFDMTPVAQDWVTNVAPVTAIMLRPKPPKGYKPGDSNAEDTWRVVMTGPKFQASDIEGVTTELVYVPGKSDETLPPPTTPPTTTTTGTTGSTGSTGTTFNTSPSDFGASNADDGSAPADSGGAAEPSPAPDVPPLEQAAGAEATPPGMPGYVWLGILVGIIAWSLVRSVVIESATGVRADGVLAQIQRMNRERRGGVVTEAAASGGAAAGLLAPIRSASRWFRDKAGALNFRKKG